ncbi:MAG: SDR family NAD(P)-dependent oxidoreductase, partial [Thermomicrobiales bacterium]
MAGATGDGDDRLISIVPAGEAPTELAPESPAAPGYAPGTFARIFDLRDRVAMVVGGGGLGTAIAAGLADYGARIALADLDQETAKRGARMCARRGVQPPIAATIDVSKPAVVRAVVKAIEEKTGKIDVLVNAAGINIRKAAIDFTPAEWQRIITINLTGVFLVTQAVARGMLDRGYGRILSIGSVSSLLGHPEHAPYAASKGGIAIMTKALATEWAPRGVTVNAIGPTYTETALTAGYLKELGERERMISSIPMGRLGRPEDIVGAAVYLCSDAAAFVTGQTLYVDGGRTS